MKTQWRTVLAGLLAMNVAGVMFAAQNPSAGPDEVGVVKSAPRHTTGGRFHFRFTATPSATGAKVTNVQLVIDTVWSGSKVPQAWTEARDASTGQRLAVRQLGATATPDGKTYQSVSVTLPAEYVAEVLEMREFRKVILESRDARDELELPREFLGGFVREVRTTANKG